MPSPMNSDEYKLLNKEIDNLNKILERERDSVLYYAQYKEKLDSFLDPLILAKYLESKKQQRIKIETLLPGTNFTLKRGLLLDLDTRLYAALLDYDGPPGVITSNKRYWNNYSKHRYGKAIDFRWNWNIIRYLGSEKGQKWLKRNNLTMYIEKRYFPTSLKKQIPKSLIHNLYDNKKATAKHIHINIRH